MRRRIIRPNVRSYTGRHVAANGSVVRFESGLERDFLTLLRFRGDVEEILEQPETFHFLDGTGATRRYTPDFLVSFVPAKRVYYEVKFREQLRRDWPRFRDSLHFMRRHAAERGAAFRVVTEITIRTPKLENARLLVPFATATPDPRIAGALLELVTSQPITILDALRAVCRSPNDRAAFYAALWPLLAQRILTTDFDKPIGMQSWLEVQL